MMYLLAHPLVRRLRTSVLKVFPTCDLQDALRERVAVSVHDLRPGDIATLQFNNSDQQRVRGPAIVTVNSD